MAIYFWKVSVLFIGVSHKFVLFLPVHKTFWDSLCISDTDGEQLRNQQNLFHTHNQQYFRVL